MNFREIKKKLKEPHIRGIFFDREHTRVYIERGFLFSKENFLLEIGETDDVKAFLSKKITRCELKRRLTKSIDWKIINDMMDNFRDFSLEEDKGNFFLDATDEEYEKIIAYDPSYEEKMTNHKLKLSFDELYELSPIMRQKSKVKPLEEWLNEMDEKHQRKENGGK